VDRVPETSVGHNFPLHCGSKGHVLLSYAGDEFIDEYLSRPLTALTSETITDPAALRDRLIRVRTQGYAITALEEKADGAISNWRMDPSVAGVSNCMGDIGTHAHNLVRYVTGLEIEQICAELSTFIPGRPLDDDGNCLIRFGGGARGILYASQVSSGDENNLNIRVYGTKGSLQWFQENPNELIWKKADAPQQVHRRGNSYLSAAAQGATRTPFAHPEGFIESFANVYRAAGTAIADAVSGRKAPKAGYDFPTVDDGVAGLAFIESAVKSSKAGAKWVKFPKL